MNLNDATRIIRAQLQRMNGLYGRPVFDEWGILLVQSGGRGQLLAYEGVRRDSFQAGFAAELRRFGPELLEGPQEAGTFDFARDGAGIQFDGYLSLGNGLYLFCNNTSQSMAGITKDPRWLAAQVPFVEMGETFQMDPVVAPS